jgi:hypothetical protein
LFIASSPSRLVEQVLLLITSGHLTEPFPAMAHLNAMTGPIQHSETGRTI